MKESEKEKPFTFTKEWIESFYEKEDPWGVKENKWLHKRASRALKLLGTHVYTQGIDLCCGEGTITSHYLVRHCNNIIGIDLSEKAIQRAKETNKQFSNIQFMDVDILKIDFDEMQLSPDLIFCSDAFCYFHRSQQKELLDKIATLKSKPIFLLVIRLMFKQFCMEHQNLVPYAPNYDFFDNWSELGKMVKDGFVIKKVEPVLEHVTESIPWGDTVVSAQTRKMFYFLFVRVLSRVLSLSIDIEKVDEMRFKLLRFYQKVPFLSWFAKRFIYFYAILLEPK